MAPITTLEDYKKRVEQALIQIGKETLEPQLACFLESQFDQLEDYLKRLPTESFWIILPYILGIDARLALFIELIHLEEFDAAEILRIIETDYKTYTKELCGYDLSMEPPHSLIFHVL